MQLAVRFAITRSPSIQITEVDGGRDSGRYEDFCPFYPSPQLVERSAFGSKVIFSPSHLPIRQQRIIKYSARHIPCRSCNITPSPVPLPTLSVPLPTLSVQRNTLHNALAQISRRYPPLPLQGVLAIVAKIDSTPAPLRQHGPQRAQHRLL